MKAVAERGSSSVYSSIKNTGNKQTIMRKLIQPADQIWVLIAREKIVEIKARR